MNNIDQIFQRSETETPLEVRPGLWRTLEKKLDSKRRKKRLRIQLFSLAAVFVILMGFMLPQVLTASSYGLEELSDEGNPLITKKEINIIHSYHHLQTQAVDLNG